MFVLEREVEQWLDHLHRKGMQNKQALNELKDHLHDLIEHLSSGKVPTREIFEQAVERMGEPDALIEEYSKNSPFHNFNKILWKDSEYRFFQESSRTLMLWFLYQGIAGLFNQRRALFSAETFTQLIFNCFGVGIALAILFTGLFLKRLLAHKPEIIIGTRYCYLSLGIFFHMQLWTRAESIGLIHVSNFIFLIAINLYLIKNIKRLATLEFERGLPE